MFRFRLRYSIRFLFLTLTLACLYFGTWQNCKVRAISEVKAATGWRPTTIIAPFLFHVSSSDNITVRNTFHVWSFAGVIDLPIASEYPEPNPVIMVVQPRLVYQPDDEIGILDDVVN